ncbi:bifunctional 5,10-methylenetetrahydrofolate dehydrogenase/5,10-methenyltetrahydrofolate cyclohydrolase [Patescibacteria group bacterium]|nr:bifunctional 5,10-methylenetetrahydrofolate dehydrogenase/5,10-methenyltetrahydrofolate cyclohydrolase [Patescibacteria group bacterium]
MQIDGKAIAGKILQGLEPKVINLKALGIVPTMAVILVSDDPASLSYIKQKQKAADTIGASVVLTQLPATTTTETLRATIQQWNRDPNIHGIIVQRPLPKSSLIDKTVLNEVAPQKDIDGFVAGSPFSVPVALAVLAILGEVFHNTQSSHNVNRWLKNQRIAVIGRGETAGKPIFNDLSGRSSRVTQIHSQTAHPEEILKDSDIIVSCVGKGNVVRRQTLKSNCILISVGLWRDLEGKLHGDYEEDDIKDIARFYTPTPGGVGPVNVACLMQNLVLAAHNQLDSAAIKNGILSKHAK